jgi:hypothetical protein
MTVIQNIRANPLRSLWFLAFGISMTVLIGSQCAGGPRPLYAQGLGVIVPSRRPPEVSRFDEDGVRCYYFNRKGYTNEGYSPSISCVVVPRDGTTVR